MLRGNGENVEEWRHGEAVWFLDKVSLFQMSAGGDLEAGSHEDDLAALRDGSLSSYVYDGNH